MQRGVSESEERPVCSRLSSEPVNIWWNLTAIFLRWGGRWHHSAESTAEVAGAAAAGGAAVGRAALALVFFFLDGVLLDGVFLDGVLLDDDDADISPLFSCFACRFHFFTSAFAVDATS